LIAGALAMIPLIGQVLSGFAESIIGQKFIDWKIVLLKSVSTR
jgi:hypothetical protein